MPMEMINRMQPALPRLVIFPEFDSIIKIMVMIMYAIIPLIIYMVTTQSYPFPVVFFLYQTSFNRGGLQSGNGVNRISILEE